MDVKEDKVVPVRVFNVSVEVFNLAAETGPGLPWLNRLVKSLHWSFMVKRVLWAKPE